MDGLELLDEHSRNCEQQDTGLCTICNCLKKAWEEYAKRYPHIVRELDTIDELESMSQNR